jgi:hypothetical protein
MFESLLIGLLLHVSLDDADEWLYNETAMRIPSALGASFRRAGNCLDTILRGVGLTRAVEMVELSGWDVRPYALHGRLTPRLGVRNVLLPRPDP